MLNQQGIQLQVQLQHEFQGHSFAFCMLGEWYLLSHFEVIQRWEFEIGPPLGKLRKKRFRCRKKRNCPNNEGSLDNQPQTMHSLLKGREIPKKITIHLHSLIPPTWVKFLIPGIWKNSRNSHVLVYNGPLLIHLLGVASHLLPLRCICINFLLFIYYPPPNPGNHDTFLGTPRHKHTFQRPEPRARPKSKWSKAWGSWWCPCRSK